jgi:hypothetical protein
VNLALGAAHHPDIPILKQAKSEHAQLKWWIGDLQNPAAFCCRSG